MIHLAQVEGVRLEPEAQRPLLTCSEMHLLRCLLRHQCKGKSSLLGSSVMQTPVF